MNLYEESDYGIISLIIGICAVGTALWWYISLPCAILTIALAYLAKDANSRITCIAGFAMGGIAVFISVLTAIAMYNTKIDNMLEELTPSKLNQKINSKIEYVIEKV